MWRSIDKSTLISNSPLLLLNYDGRKTETHEDRVHQKPRCSTVAIGKGVNVHQFVMSNCGKFNRMHFARLFWVHPLEKWVHEDVNLLRLRWNVITNVDLSSTKNSAFYRIHMAKHSFMYLEDVLKAYVVVSKRKQENLISSLNRMRN